MNINNGIKGSFKKGELVHVVDENTLKGNWSFWLDKDLEIAIGDIITDAWGSKFKALTNTFPLIVCEVED